MFLAYLICIIEGPQTQPDFDIVVFPSAQIISSDQIAVYNVTVVPQNNWTKPVNLILSGQPKDSVYAFSENPVHALVWNSTLFIKPGSTTGKFTLTITGIGGGKTHRYRTSLTITGAQVFYFSLIGPIFVFIGGLISAIFALFESLGIKIPKEKEIREEINTIMKVEGKTQPEATESSELLKKAKRNRKIYHSLIFIGATIIGIGTFLIAIGFFK